MKSGSLVMGQHFLQVTINTFLFPKFQHRVHSQIILDLVLAVQVILHHCRHHVHCGSALMKGLHTDTAFPCA